MSTSETDPRNDDQPTPTIDPYGDGGERDTNSGQQRDALSGLAGWAVVGALVVAGIIAPAILYVAGQTGDLQALGLGFKNTYLAVPMIPAALLGAIGIWSALKDR